MIIARIGNLKLSMHRRTVSGRPSGKPIYTIEESWYSYNTPTSEIYRYLQNNGCGLYNESTRTFTYYKKQAALQDFSMLVLKFG